MTGELRWRVVGRRGMPQGNEYIPCLDIEYLDGQGVSQPLIFPVKGIGGFRRLEDALRAAAAITIEGVNENGEVILGNAPGE